MKKIVTTLALSLALGTAACGRSDEASNTVAGSDVVLNDEDALTENDAALAAGPLDNATVTNANSSVGNAF